MVPHFSTHTNDMKLRTVKFLSPGKQHGVMCYNQPEDGKRDSPRVTKVLEASHCFAPLSLSRRCPTGSSISLSENRSLGCCWELGIDQSSRETQVGSTKTLRLGENVLGAYPRTGALENPFRVICFGLGPVDLFRLDVSFLPWCHCDIV